MAGYGFPPASSSSYMPANTKHKVVFVMGATATGKSRMAIDLAHEFASQIINCDKIQVYRGLDVVTNKVLPHEQAAVPHHLIDIVDDPEFDFTAAHFCAEAMVIIQQLHAKGQIPIIVGGSNSFIEQLVEDRDLGFKSRYECFFVWMDVAEPVLFDSIGKRVDQMLRRGLVEQGREMYSPVGVYSRGLRRAIGVPEMHEYYRLEQTTADANQLQGVLAAAVQEIKANTRALARRQVGKIQRLRDELGWPIERVDATAVYTAQDEEQKEHAWGEVYAPCRAKVLAFMYHL